MLSRLSADVTTVICEALERGESKAAAARRAGVSIRSVHRWWAAGLDAWIAGDRGAPEAKLVLRGIRARRRHFGALLGKRP